MNLITLTNGEPWMTPQEREINHQLIHAFAEYLTTARIQDTALVTLRVNDITATWLLARRLESALTPTEAEPVPCPTPAQANAIGKCRDRLRRAIKELEACCPRNAQTVQQGCSLFEQLQEAVRVVRAPGIQDAPTAANEYAPKTAGPSQRHHQQAPAKSATHASTVRPTHEGVSFPGPRANVNTRKQGAPNAPASGEHNRHHEPPHATHTPHDPNPKEAPPPPNRATRRRQAREERRNRTGRSKMAPMGTYRRTTPKVDQHSRTDSAHHGENGSGTQRGGMSRPG